MGREVRKVPPGWKHPKDSQGRYVPLFDRPKHDHGKNEYYMPRWKPSERTRLMMYENTTEGTPISPAFDTPERLARWLADNGASSFGSMTATYEQWLAMARDGSAPSMVMDSKGLRSGVAAAIDHPPKAPGKPQGESS